MRSAGHTFLVNEFRYSTLGPPSSRSDGRYSLSGNMSDPQSSSSNATWCRSASASSCRQLVAAVRVAGGVLEAGDGVQQGRALALERSAPSVEVQAGERIQRQRHAGRSRCAPAAPGRAGYTGFSMATLGTARLRATMSMRLLRADGQRPPVRAAPPCPAGTGARRSPRAAAGSPGSRRTAPGPGWRSTERKQSSSSSRGNSSGSMNTLDRRRLPARGGAANSAGHRLARRQGRPGQRGRAPRPPSAAADEHPLAGRALQQAARRQLVVGRLHRVLGQPQLALQHPHRRQPAAAPGCARPRISRA